MIHRLWILTPRTIKITALKKDYATDSLSIMNRETLYIEYE